LLGLGIERERSFHMTLCLKEDTKSGLGAVSINNAVNFLYKHWLFPHTDATIHRMLSLNASQVLGKQATAVGVIDKVSEEQFQQAWAALGVTVAPLLATAMFNKYGHDARNRMPVMVSTIMHCYLVSKQSH
jgi:hypothetical protein